MPGLEVTKLIESIVKWETKLKINPFIKPDRKQCKDDEGMLLKVYF